MQSEVNPVTFYRKQWIHPIDSLGINIPYSYNVI